MTKNTRSLWIIILVLIVVNLLSLGSLWMTRASRPLDNVTFKTRTVDPGHFIPSRLDFSPEQTKSFDSLANLHRADLSRTMDDIRSLRRQLMDQVGKNEPDKTGDLIHKIGQMHEELEKINFWHFQNVMNICQEDQREDFRKMLYRGFRARELNRHMRRERRHRN